MKVYKIEPLRYESNSYLVTQDGIHAFAVDPSEHTAEEAKRLGLTVEYVLLTHGHYDHIGGCAAFQEEGARIGCMADEVHLIYSEGNLASRVGVNIPHFEVDFTMRDGQSLSLCGIKVNVISTPGHTIGGGCYYAEGSMFTGDTIFQGSVGRDDFPTGNAAQLQASLKKLCRIQQNYILYCGHGENTFLSLERDTNPYIQP